MTETVELPDITFQSFGKIPRLHRGCTITEKIDGTNAAVQIVPFSYDTLTLVGPTLTEAKRNIMLNLPAYVTAVVDDPSNNQLLYVVAQSRKRIITPAADNAGFAEWVLENAEGLATTLGPGIHFGEWWGLGIQRRYGMATKKFSLFNTHRWNLENTAAVPGLGVVPILSQGIFSTQAIEDVMQSLRDFGSVAAPGFNDPEGIIVYHHAAGTYSKVTLVGDEEPKSVAERKAARATAAQPVTA